MKHNDNLEKVKEILRGVSIASLSDGLGIGMDELNAGFMLQAAGYRP